MRRFYSTLFAVALLGFFELSAIAQTTTNPSPGALDLWTQRATAENITGLSFVNGKFLMGMAEGSILSSSDGMTWEHMTTPVDLNGAVNGFAYGQGRIVAVGTRGEIFTSLDGVSWSPQWSGIEGALQSVAFGNGRFVAVGGSATTQARAILTSIDAVHWTVQDLSSGQGILWKVVFEHGEFIVTGNFGALLTSTDGKRWHSITNLTRGRLSGIAYGNGQFIVVGNGGVFSSPDGSTWKTNRSGDSAFFDVTYNSGLFVASGDNTRLWTSVDGLHWIPTQTASPFPLALITSDGGRLVTGGQNGTFGVSTNGLHWEIHTSGATSLFEQIALGKGRMAAVDGSALITSVSGASWESPFQPGKFGFGSIHFAGGQFIAFGLYTADSTRFLIANSTDGAAWTLKVFPLPFFPNKVVYGNGLYVAASDAFFVSRDGAKWSITGTPVRGPLSGLAYGNDRFVALRQDGRVYISSDGTNWVMHQTSNFGLIDVAFGNGVFVAVGDGNREREVMVSGDGENWIHAAPPDDARTLTDVTFGGGRFVAVGWGGTIISSPDGLLWTKHNSRTTSNLSSIAYDNGKFVAVGNNGTVIVSEALSSLNISVSRDKTNGITLSLTANPNRIYSIESTASLTTPLWKEVGRITNSTEETVFFYPNQFSKQFYRSVEIPTH